MNIKTLLVGAGLVVAGTAFAATPYTVKQFPGHTPVRESVPMSASDVQKAPLNPNKSMGTQIFGYTTLDRNGPKHYVDFWSAAASKLNRLAPVSIEGATSFDDSDPRNVVAWAGGWAGDAYYAYRFFRYTFAFGLIDYVKVDPKTGQSEIIKDWRGYGYGPDWWTVTFPQDLVWNPNDNKSYILCQNPNSTGNDAVTSLLKNFDLQTGQYGSDVKVFDTYYFTGAFDMDNQFYGITWSYDEDGVVTGTVMDVLDAEDNFRRISSTPLKVDGKNWLINYDNNMTIDYTTGDIWWVAVRPTDGGTSEEIRLIKIDPLTYATENMGYVGQAENVAGMYIDYKTAESRRAPAQVKNAEFIIDPNGDDKVTLKWTNPSTLWNRRNMNNLSSVEVYRDAYPGTPVATITATAMEGKDMQWTDETAAAGIHKYYIIPVNANGKGVPYDLDAFVGKDAPGEVNNIQISSPDGKSISLSWEKPTRGDNDGWFDDSDLTYTLVRLPDNVNVGSTKELSFTDNTLPETQRYSYQIYASNAQGSGSMALSDALLAGSGIRPPFSTDFASSVDADRFSFIDRNGDGRRFEYDFNTNLRRNTYKINLSDYDNDDILVSPTLLLEKGKKYRVTYKIYYSGFIGSQFLKGIAMPSRIVGGTAPTNDAMTDIHVDDLEYTRDFPSKSEDYVAYFTSPVDGEYYIGYETLVKGLQNMWIYIENFDIECAPDDDLEAKALKAHLYLSTVENNKIDVEVYNNGDNDQNAYKVKLAVLDAQGKPNVFAETSDVPAVKSHESVIASVNAKMPALGEQKLVAIVDLPGDGNDHNNMTDPLIVQCDEAGALNVTVNVPNLRDQPSITNIPFNHYSACTASQTIYTPEMTMLDQFEYADRAYITRIAWQGRSVYDNQAPFEDTNLAVYMSQTEKNGFAYDEPKALIPVQGNPLFDDVVPLKSGFNYVVVDFDEDFEFDPTAPLLVTVLKEDYNHSDFLFGWDAFDDDWEAAQYSIYHSICCTGGSPINIATPNVTGTLFPHAPVLHLAVKGISGDGVGQIVIDNNNTVFYNKTASLVEANFAMASVEVYNINGQLVDRVNAAGAKAVNINAGQGVSIIKVTATDGKVLSFKIII